MTRRIYVLSLLWAICASVGWMLWCWHDETAAGGGLGARKVREPTRADRAAAVMFAVGRVALAASALEMLRIGMKKEQMTMDEKKVEYLIRIVEHCCQCVLSAVMRAERALKREIAPRIARRRCCEESSDGIALSAGAPSKRRATAAGSGRCCAAANVCVAI